MQQSLIGFSTMWKGMNGTERRERGMRQGSDIGRGEWRVEW